MWDFLQTFVPQKNLVVQFCFVQAFSWAFELCILGYCIPTETQKPAQTEAVN